MKGFILKLNRAKNEDMVVTILSEHTVDSYYRFYGARHSVLQLGYLIDFEVEQDKSNFLPRIRSITHNGFQWLYNREKLMNWHRFISIFEPHFRDVKEIDSFYFYSLLDTAKKWEKQNSRRLIVETFTNILKYEGRINNLSKCVICGSKIENELSLIKGFMPTHPFCSHSVAVDKNSIENLFGTSSTLMLNDDTVEVLSEIALKGF